MKKIVYTLIICVVAANSFAQTTTYNVFNYKKPAGYKEEKKQGFISYTKTNSAKGTYCIIGLYEQTKASATLDENFTTNWQELIAQPYSVTDLPQTENAEEQEGWKTKLGLAQFDFNGGKTAAMLLTLQNGATDANIVVITNGQEYMEDLDKLLANLKMSKPLGISNSINKENTLPTTQTISTTNKSKLVGSIAGVWLAYTNDYVASKNLKWKSYIFFNDGKVRSDDMPSTGLLNYESAKDKYGYTQGYEFNETTKTGKIIEYKSTPTPIKWIKANQIKVGIIDYLKSDNLNGKTISGSFSFNGFKKEDYNSTGYYPIIHFDKQGNFKDDGFLTYLSGAGKKINNISALQGTGRYAISEYTLILTYNDGRTNAVPIATPFGLRAEEAKQFLILNELTTRLTDAPELNVKQNAAKATTASVNKDILGEWYLSDGNAKITLLFGANGQYDKGALVDRRIVSNLFETTTIKGKGTYILNGTTLTLTPPSGVKEVYQIRFSTDTDSEGKPMRILHLKRPVAGGEMYESDYYFVK